MTDALILNPTWLRNRLAQLGLRQWWLAEQLGVDRKTVLRWVNGQVRQIQPANAQALATVLDCRVDELLLHETTAQLATAQDQRAAGIALAGSALVDRLGPVGEWDVIEQLVRAAAVPDLPLPVLGRLYHQLCVACWRQDKFEQAQVHNAAALDIAQRCDDRALLADALGSGANLQHWRGECVAAQASWRRALTLSPWLTPRQRGALHNNLGAALVESGDWEEGGTELDVALECFDAEGTPMNRSIIHAQRSLLALLQDDADAAEREAARALGQARRGDYRRGLALAPLLQALVAARRGQPAVTEAALARSLAAFAALGIDDATNHVWAARAWRWLGQGRPALAGAKQALQAGAALPLERSAALHEQALALAMLGRGDDAQASLQAACDLYRRCGAHAMVARLPSDAH